jgi:hypothetical protein
MLVELYYFNQNYHLLFGHMSYCMQCSSLIESPLPYLTMHLPTSFFITNYLMSIFLKYLVAFVMLPLYTITEPNSNLEPERQFSWITSLVTKALFFLISPLEKSSFPDMFHFMSMYSLTLKIPPPHT